MITPNEYPGTVSLTQHRYRMGPFVYETHLAFPELQSQETETRSFDQIQVRIRQVDTLPERLDDGLEIGDFCSVTTDCYLLHKPEVARFLVRKGSEVLFAPVAGVQERDLRLFLLGSIFAVLCHQNGFLPLHASAVERDGKVTAFVAQSGAGKSTLAAFLSRRGFRVVADDICLLRLDQPGELRVIPVGGWLKLWQTSLDALGETAEERHRVISQEDKFRLYLRGNEISEPDLRLRYVVFLHRPEEENVSHPQLPSLTALKPAVALADLMDGVYNAYLLHRLGLEPRLFAQCGQVVSGATCLQVLAPWGWDAMIPLLDLLDERLR